MNNFSLHGFKPWRLFCARINIFVPAENGFETLRLGEESPFSVFLLDKGICAIALIRTLEPINQLMTDRFSLLILATVIISCNTDCKKKVIETHSNGQTKKLREYPKCWDSLTYEEKQFYPSGKIEWESFTTPTEKFVEFKSWYENGQQSAQWKLQDNKEHGHILCWYDNGNLKREGFLFEGLETGLHKEWHSNGQLAQLGKYMDNGKDSVWTYWLESGVLKMTETYNDGLLDGVTRVFHNHGKTKIELVYNNGLKDGIYKQWDTSGQLIKDFVYEKDSLIKRTVDKD